MIEGKELGDVSRGWRGGKDYGCGFCTWHGLHTRSSVDVVFPDVGME